MEALNNVAVATDVAETTQEKAENNIIIDFKMVTFSLSGKDYSIDIMHVKEIAKAGRFTFVPNTLPFVLGVYNLRGEIIPILDLRLFFNIEVPERDENKLENLLILSVDDQNFGVVVDKIDKVVGVQKSTIQPPHPLFGDINIKYIDGVVESNNHLYVLLDVTKIFSTKENLESTAAKENSNKIPMPAGSSVVQTPKESPRPVAKAAVEKQPEAKNEVKAAPKVETASKANEEVSVNNEKLENSLKFLKEALDSNKKFYVTSVNESWIKHRYSEWTKQKGEGAQLQNPQDAEEFLKPFWSNCTDAWWSKAYAENLEKILPDNSAKQINVWNPGCGKGFETYSLACILKKRYPDSKIRIYAQDIDLLGVSNAALISVPNNLSTDWYGPYLTKKANGDYTFSQEIKDSIMFEYHDCKNTNALPMVDIVFARDILSLLDENAQNAVVTDFLEKMKGNGIAIIGENEAMPASFNFGENTVDALVAYTKD